MASANRSASTVGPSARLGLSNSNRPLLLDHLTSHVDSHVYRGLAEQGWRYERWRDSHVEELETGSSSAVVVCDLDSASDAKLLHLCHLIGRVPTRIPIILRMTLTRDAACRLIGLTDQTPVPAYVSIRGVDSLEHDIQLAQSRIGETAGTSSIVSRIGVEPNDQLLDITIGAMILGRRRSTVPNLARACNASSRTIESRLRTAGGPGAARLLASAVCLHSAWRLGVLHLPVKQAAAQAHFRSRLAFNNFVKRHTGAPPSALRHSAMFENLIADVRERLNSRAVGIRSVSPRPAVPSNNFLGSLEVDSN